MKTKQVQRGCARFSLFQERQSMAAFGAQLPPENAFVAAAIWGSADPLERSARDASTPSGHWIFH
jgi:hypothetical protein